LETRLRQVEAGDDETVPEAGRRGGRRRLNNNNKPRRPNHHHKKKSCVDSDGVSHAHGTAWDQDQCTECNCKVCPLFLLTPRFLPIGIITTANHRVPDFPLK